MNEKTPDSAPRFRQGMDYGEHEEVQEVHAAIQREKREPRVGLEPLSIWLIVVYGLAVLFGGLYLGRYSGNFSGDGLDWFVITPHFPHKGGGAQGPSQQAELSPVERGKKVFLANCAVCHQPNGEGSPTQGYPPLAGSEIVNGGSRRVAMIVLKGLQGPIKVKGMQFGTAVMQPWEKTLNDQKIADVITYIRQEWGNKGGPVTPEQIAALRKELATRAESFTEPDILSVPADTELPGGEASGPKPGEPPKPGPSPATSPQPKA
jgi:mono/diheme cytochrome c family protein